MYQIPSPPTDNLYKFISISGTLLLIISFTFVTFFELRLNQKIADNTGDIAVTKNKLEYVTHLIKQIESDIADLGGENSTIEDMQEYIGELSKDSSAHQSSLREIIDLNQKSMKKNITNQWLAEDLKRLIFLKKLGMIAGSFLMVCGFSLWYFQVQRHLDVQLRKKNSE